MGLLFKKISISNILFQNDKKIISRNGKPLKINFKFKFLDASASANRNDNANIINNVNLSDSSCVDSGSRDNDQYTFDVYGGDGLSIVSLSVDDSGVAGNEDIDNGVGLGRGAGRGTGSGAGRGAGCETDLSREGINRGSLRDDVDGGFGRGTGSGAGRGAGRGTGSGAGRGTGSGAGRGAGCETDRSREGINRGSLRGDVDGGLGLSAVDGNGRSPSRDTGPGNIGDSGCGGEDRIKGRHRGKAPNTVTEGTAILSFYIKITLSKFKLFIKFYKEQNNYLPIETRSRTKTKAPASTVSEDSVALQKPSKKRKKSNL